MAKNEEVNTVHKELKNHIPTERIGLRKVKNIDDLLLQVHSNPDSQYLFKIPVEILEKYSICLL